MLSLKILEILILSVSVHIFWNLKYALYAEKCDWPTLTRTFLSHCIWFDPTEQLTFSDNPAMAGPVPNAVCSLDLPILEAGCDIQCSCCTDECAGT